MATKKETFMVKGKELTLHEKQVFEKVQELGKVDYDTIAKTCGISQKSAIATLARLNKTHGLLKKNEPIKVTTYEIENGTE